MTSLIFGSIYLGHKTITQHHREKQRVKNYERWEGLRDDYDEQRRISRESRSLDIQRTGSTWQQEEDNDRPIMTLRDQQEANDARTSWRPQETWDGPRAPQVTGMGAQRHASLNAVGSPAPQLQQQDTSTMYANPTSNNPFTSGIRSQKTGAWDEGMPQPLRVSRQSFEDYDHHAALGRGRTSSVPGRLSQTDQRRSSGEFERRQGSIVHAPSNLRSDSTTSSSAATPPQQSVVTEVQQFTLPPARQFGYGHQQVQKQPMFDIEPVESHVPGGRMAELIERGF